MATTAEQKERVRKMRVDFRFSRTWKAREVARHKLALKYISSAAAPIDRRAFSQDGSR